MIRFDEFLGGLNRLQQAVMRGYFNRAGQQDNRWDARSPAAWRAILDAEMKRPTP